MVKNRVDIITLGCSKNLVDSEHLMRQFEAAGYEVRHDAEKVTGEIVVINTCGFIGDAKEESINMIFTESSIGINCWMIWERNMCLTFVWNVY